MTRVNERHTRDGKRSWYQRSGVGLGTAAGWWAAKPDDAVLRIRRADKSEQIILAPTTPEGRAEALEAARDVPGIEVSEYRVWITPSGWINGEWLIRRYGRKTRGGFR